MIEVYSTLGIDASSIVSYYIIKLKNLRQVCRRELISCWKEDAKLSYGWLIGMGAQLGGGLKAQRRIVRFLVDSILFILHNLPLEVRTYPSRFSQFAGNLGPRVHLLGVESPFTTQNRLTT